MSQHTFNRVFSIAFVALGVVYLVGHFSGTGASFFSGLPTSTVALIVLVSSCIMFRINMLARKEARDRRGR